MKKDLEVLNYLKTILKKCDDPEEAKSLIEDFKNYLSLTMAVDDDMIDYIDDIIKSVPSFYNLLKVSNKEELLETFDFTKMPKQKAKTKTKTKSKSYEDRHYDDYHSNNDTSYSDRCGGGSYYTRRTC